jgi:hypothetical protein
MQYYVFTRRTVIAAKDEHTARAILAAVSYAHSNDWTDIAAAFKIPFVEVLSSLEQFGELGHLQGSPILDDEAQENARDLYIYELDNWYNTPTARPVV